MRFNTTILGIVLAAFLFLGCTTPAPDSSATPFPSAFHASVVPNLIVKAVLATDEDASITLSYDRGLRQAMIEAVQYMDANQTAQLPIACAIQSAFLVRINDASLYGQTARVNGTLYVRIPWEKYENYVSASGLTRAEFDAMNVTSAVIRFKTRQNDAVMSECVNLKSQKITLDGKELNEKEITESAQSGVRSSGS